MSVRILPQVLLFAGLVACTGQTDDADRPAAVDSAIAAFQAEAAPPLPTAESVAGPLVVGNDTAVTRTRYLCRPDVAVFAIFWRGENSRVVLNVADTQLVLPQVPAASGSRYRVESPLTEWWSKGDSATFAFDDSRLACAVNTDVVF